uniref:Uncharacterized protein n=1 Tax=Oryza nivara TaxID=4536 RepID=A0A0E0HDL3_ORYNI
MRHRKMLDLNSHIDKEQYKLHVSRCRPLVVGPTHRFSPGAVQAQVGGRRTWSGAAGVGRGAGGDARRGVGRHCQTWSEAAGARHGAGRVRARSNDGEATRSTVRLRRSLPAPRDLDITEELVTFFGHEDLMLVGPSTNVAWILPVLRTWIAHAECQLIAL